MNACARAATWASNSGPTSPANGLLPVGSTRGEKAWLRPKEAPRPPISPHDAAHLLGPAIGTPQRCLHHARLHVTAKVPAIRSSASKTEPSGWPSTPAEAQAPAGLQVVRCMPALRVAGIAGPGYLGWLHRLTAAREATPNTPHDETNYPLFADAAGQVAVLDDNTLLASPASELWGA
jgi:hypothetical protein